MTTTSVSTEAEDKVLHALSTRRHPLPDRSARGLPCRERPPPEGVHAQSRGAAARQDRAQLHALAARPFPDVRLDRAVSDRDPRPRAPTDHATAAPGGARWRARTVRARVHLRRA